MATNETEATNFIRRIIDEDIARGWNDGRVHTRFPPEPNGYLHIGHAKAIWLNYSIAKDYNGLFNLRFDDTNPTKEEQEYVDAIINDVKWLGVDWGDRLFFTADYFDRMYECAVQLIKDGKAYVDDLSADEIREYRGTLTEPGQESPYRNRSVEENLDLFERMKNGEFPDGARVLRAKIDMASPNINMRDPVIYRIRHASHHRTGDKWCIYPMYDFAHPLEDAFENITHSLCSIEYADHNELYEWVLDNVDYSGPGITGRPKQIEFARLNLSHTVMSKRKLRRLVEEGVVEGWDDPRMPTIAGLRRRGYTPESIRIFCERIGVARSDSIVDIAFLEHCVREDLNASAPRLMAVLRPLKITLENYPEGQVEWVEIENNPEDPDAGNRLVPFGRELYIEREDFMENPPRKFYRLAPGREMRLKGAYIIKCERVIKDADGNITELICSYDPESKSGMPGADRKVKATAHWVSAQHAVPVTVRLYDHLFLKENPDDAPPGKDFMANLNPNSLEVLTNCLAEPEMRKAKPGDRFQFLRQGYFFADPIDSKDGKLVFNKIVGLRDTWKRKRQ
ncbi:MAG: glutamine--tRNA ligase/YqeY domain fusion protein [Firmicutes bacterium]|nr:glutamine--tRNA ligase/YqeY domain fusion protein [Bacillota bacterium]